METEELSIIKLCKKYIRGTPEKSIIQNVTILLCKLTRIVQKEGNFDNPKIYINTRVLKHIYDKRPAEEFDFIIHNLFQIVRFPEQIYKNKDAKRGEISFVKTVNCIKYFCSIEKTETLDTTNNKMNFIVTAFRIRKESYLEGYKLIWSWRSDISSS